MPNFEHPPKKNQRGLPKNVYPNSHTRLATETHVPKFGGTIRI